MAALHTMFIDRVNPACINVVHGLFTVAPVEKARPIDRALALAKSKGMNQSGFAAAIGVSPQDITNWKARDMPPEHFARASDVLGCTMDELAKGSSGTLQPKAQSPKGVPTEVGPYLGVTLAHQMSEMEQTVEPQEIIWGSLLTISTLPGEFKLALDDDALAPAYPAGALFIWSTTKVARIGSVVLVRDAFGQPHARRYGQGRAPGQWVAEATGAGFMPFDGAEVVLLAVAEEERRPMP